MRKLGLIGGLGPLATIHYYRELVKAQPGEMLIIHADMDRVRTEVERANMTELAAYFARLIERLQGGGAEIAAISAVTPHICIRELEKLSPLPLVNMVEELGREIRARGLRKIALFGTRFVVESRLFGMLDGTGVAGVEVLGTERSEEIHEAYMAAVRGSTEVRETFCRIARELPVDAVVLAGTDLSPLFETPPFPCVDSTQVHVQAILRDLRT